MTGESLYLCVRREKSRPSTFGFFLVLNSHQRPTLASIGLFRIHSNEIICDVFAVQIAVNAPCSFIQYVADMSEHFRSRRRNRYCSHTVKTKCYSKLRLNISTENTAGELVAHVNLDEFKLCLQSTRPNQPVRTTFVFSTYLYVAPAVAYSSLGITGKTVLYSNIEQIPIFHTKSIRHVFRIGPGPHTLTKSER